MNLQHYGIVLALEAGTLELLCGGVRVWGYCAVKLEQQLVCVCGIKGVKCHCWSGPAYRLGTSVLAKYSRMRCRTWVERMGTRDEKGLCAQ